MNCTVKRNLLGQRFGRLLILHAAARVGDRTAWICLCDCGVIKIVTTKALRVGSTHSCGCMRMQHGQSARTGKPPSPSYQSWTAMIQRCRNPNAAGYRNYGGRGITICKRWLSFPDFFADMGARPKDTELDRINNDGNYEPGNCRWATPAIQGSNRRTNRIFTFEGRTQTLSEWAREIGVNVTTLWDRVKRGMPFEQAIK